MKYYIVAGEPSGDLHASFLMKEIKNNDKDADFRCWGGDLMEQNGGEIVKHYKELAFMGFVEVLLNLKTILNNLVICKTDILLYQPDVVILVDYPGFNLKIAKFAKENNFKVVYYISPQIWAWKKGRVNLIKKYVDKMLTILPFEKEFYAKYNYEVDYVGHPLLDEIEHTNGEENNFREQYSLSEKPIIALLPGSRKQEIKKMLPLMLQVVDYFTDYQFIISGVTWQEISLYKNILKEKNIPILFDNDLLLRHASAAIVTSGTATLETALYNVPQVVCYKGNIISYYIARWLIKDIQHISLVNIIADKEIVRELIQKELNLKNLQKELKKITDDSEKIEQIQKDYLFLRKKLGGKGTSKRAADIIKQFLSTKSTNF
ncbi:MAG TPA: lipid-A-disaccharide synthase [Bacteroidales bacterium]|nr:lipid-A-disaccharide synthase [Bacteroidales bacterium]HRR04080.1 lipid-A-disaccharide synthase [Bacteroidales bacterium]